MTAFEYVFGFFSLLLGIAAANVAAGFADMWRDRRQVRVGVATPLIAVCVLLAIMNVWIGNWTNRDVVTVAGDRLIYAAIAALPYVFVSRILFPSSGQGTDLEEHFFAHRRVVLAALVIPPIYGRFYHYVFVGDYDTPLATAYYVARIALPIALIFVASRRATLVGLCALVALMTFGLFR